MKPTGIKIKLMEDGRYYFTIIYNENGQNYEGYGSYYIKTVIEFLYAYFPLGYMDKMTYHIE